MKPSLADLFTAVLETRADRDAFCATIAMLGETPTRTSKLKLKDAAHGDALRTFAAALEAASPTLRTRFTTWLHEQANTRA